MSGIDVRKYPLRPMPDVQIRKPEDLIQIDVGQPAGPPPDLGEVVENDDGGITLFAPAIIGGSLDVDTHANFDENLAKKLGSGDLAAIASEVHEGVDTDVNAQSAYMANLTEGLGLLGLDIRSPSQVRATDGSVSTIVNPELLAAVVKGQSMARGEMYPADGPVKVKVRGDDTDQLDEVATAFQKDFNWYLTQGAPEYIPDGDRGLFGFFYSGNWFRKVYNHPLLRRPVADSIKIDDMIVSPEAVDLDTALRVTHRNRSMTRQMVKRMQLFGDWREVDIQPGNIGSNAFGDRIGQILGTNMSSSRPQDVPPVIDETIVDLDLRDFGLREKGIPAGLPVSYAVTMDWDNREVLAIRRSWRPDDETFRRKHPFVHYAMIPAFQFLALGYVHLLGNSANMLTAMWRCMADAAMFANFPGGFRAKGVRMNDNNINPAPGQFPDIDLGSFDDIRKVLMPLPYKDVTPGIINVAQIIAADAQKLSAAVDLSIGEGKTNIPVGTMLAMVEQGTQVMSAVHKRMHTAQARELQLLRECFVENPEALSKVNPNPARRWQTAEEFANYDVAPVSDPNVPAQVHRIILANAMVSLAAANPGLYDQFTAHKRAWSMIGVGDAETFLHPPAPQQGADPAAAAKEAAQAQLQGKMIDAQVKERDSQRKAAQAVADAEQRRQEGERDDARAEADRQSKEEIAHLRANTEREKMAQERLQTAAQLAQAEHHHQIEQHGAALDRRQRDMQQGFGSVS